MPDNYIDKSIIGFDSSDDLKTQVDTYNRLSSILNPVDRPALTGNEKSVLTDQRLPSLNQGTEYKLPDINLQDALSSDDPNIRSIGRKMLDNQATKIPEFNLDLGRTIESPYDTGKKFLNKDYGYSALRDNEDFYYNNDYLDSNVIARNLIYNPAKFIGRVAGQTVLKLGEGFGYLGSMITSIGSENYMQNVADNAFSKYLTEAEESFKNNIIPVYKQAGFDEKGFFSKLGDASFWNESVADGVSFMLAQVADTFLLGNVGKLGLLGKVGRAGLPAALKFATGAEDVAGAVGLVRRVAGEAAFEAAGGFKTVKEQLTRERKQGLNDLTDQEIESQASKQAAGQFRDNLMILGVSGAFENKFIFQPLRNKFRGIKPGQVAPSPQINIGEDLTASARTFNYATKAGKFTDWKNPLGKVQFYGKRALSATAMEGYWEENAQLATERLHTGKNKYDGFWSQLIGQTRDASTLLGGVGDQEVAESIGLGALIGIGGTAIISKFIQNERREKIDSLDRNINELNQRSGAFLSLNDIYETDSNTGKPVEGPDGEYIVDPKKGEAVIKGLEEFSKIQANLEQVSDPLLRSNLREDLLSRYAYAAIKAGVYDKVLSRFDKFSEDYLISDPTTIENPAELKGTLEEFKGIYDEAESSSVLKPEGVSDADFQSLDTNRKYILYQVLSQQRNARVSKDIVSNNIAEDDSNPAVDSSLQEYNKLVFKLAGLNQFDEYQKQNGTFYKSYIEDNRKNIESRLKEIEESLKDKINKKELFKDDSDLIYTKGSYRGLDNTQKKISLSMDLNNLKKLGELENSEEQWSHTSSRLSDKQFGIDNLELFNEYHKKVADKDSFVDQSQSTQTSQGEDTSNPAPNPPTNTGSSVTNTQTQTQTNTPQPGQNTDTNVQGTGTPETPEPTSTTLTPEEDIERRKQEELETPANPKIPDWYLDEFNRIVGTYKNLLLPVVNEAYNELTKAQIAKKILSDQKDTDAKEIVNTLRTYLGIPSMDDKTEFLKWKAKIDNINAKYDAELAALKDITQTNTLDPLEKEFDSKFSELYSGKDGSIVLKTSDGSTTSLVSYPEYSVVVYKRITDEQKKDFINYLNTQLSDIPNQLKETGVSARTMSGTGTDGDLRTQQFETNIRSREKVLNKLLTELVGVKEETEVTPGPAPVTITNVEEVSDVTVGETSIGDLEYIHEKNPISYVTPLKTTTQQTDFKGDEETLRNDNYSTVMAEFIKGIDSFGTSTSPVIVSDRLEWITRLPENTQKEIDYKADVLAKVKPLGQVVVFKKGTEFLKVGDIKSFANKYPELKDYPVILSMDDTAFFKKLDARAVIKAREEKITVDEAKRIFQAQKDLINTVRENIKKDSSVEIPIFITRSTGGIYPRTSTTQVSKRFGEGSYEIRVVTKDSPRHLQKHGVGSVVAEFKGNKSLPVFTDKVGKSVAWPILDELLNFKYNSRDDAFKVRDYLNKLIYNTKDQGFIVLADNTVKYSPDFSKKVDATTDPTNSKVRDLRFNVSNKLLTGKELLTTYEIKNGDLTSMQITQEQYQNFIDGNLLTNIKKVTDPSGELYTETINPYFTFELKEAPKVVTKQKSSVFLKYKKQVDSKGELTQSSKVKSIDFVQKSNDLTQEERAELVNYILAKPLKPEERYIPPSEQREVINLGNLDGEQESTTLPEKVDQTADIERRRQEELSKLDPDKYKPLLKEVQNIRNINPSEAQVRNLGQKLLADKAIMLNVKETDSYQILSQANYRNKIESNLLYLSSNIETKRVNDKYDAELKALEKPTVTEEIKTEIVEPTEVYSEKLIDETSKKTGRSKREILEAGIKASEKTKEPVNAVLMAFKNRALTDLTKSEKARIEAFKEALNPWNISKTDIELVTEMLNGKMITEFTVAEQLHLNNIPISEKEKIKAELEKNQKVEVPTPENLDSFFDSIASQEVSFSNIEPQSGTATTAKPETSIVTQFADDSGSSIDFGAGTVSGFLGINLDGDQISDLFKELNGSEGYSSAELVDEAGVKYYALAKQGQMNIITYSQDGTVSDLSKVSLTKESKDKLNNLEKINCK